MTLNRRRRFGAQEPTKSGGTGSRHGPPLLHVGVMAKPDWSGETEPFRRCPTSHNHCAEVLGQKHTASRSLGPTCSAYWLPHVASWHSIDLPSRHRACSWWITSWIQQKMRPSRCVLCSHSIDLWCSGASPDRHHEQMNRYRCAGLFGRDRLCPALVVPARVPRSPSLLQSGSLKAAISS